MGNLFLRAEEVQQILGVSKSYAYKVIKEMNSELQRQGDPGEGKTTLVLQIIARLTKGESIINEDANPPINVIYQTAEDGLADTIKPRLLAANADCSKVLVIDDKDTPLTMRDVRLEQAIIETNAKLVVLDPIQGFLGADVDMHRANEIRPVMKHIAELAEKYKCAIILIGHMNKCSMGKSAYRGLGSIDFQDRKSVV